MACVMNGVKKASKKFHNQLDMVATAAWAERVRVGKLSPVRIQAPGAQVDAKPRMKRQADTIITRERT